VVSFLQYCDYVRHNEVFMSIRYKGINFVTHTSSSVAHNPITAPHPYPQVTQ
jgi:hypothetical protein